MLFANVVLNGSWRWSSQSGGAFGLTLLFMGAPLWVFYVGQISMAPWIFWELLHLDAKEKREQEAKATEASRQRETSRSVA
jgi:hypothetical protein